MNSYSGANSHCSATEFLLVRRIEVRTCSCTPLVAYDACGNSINHSSPRSIQLNDLTIDFLAAPIKNYLESQAPLLISLLNAADNLGDAIMFFGVRRDGVRGKAAKLIYP